MANKKNHIEELASRETEFKREISLFGGVSIIGGIMIGSGIFYLGSYVLQRTGFNFGLSILAWILGGIISLLGGLCFAELGASIPKAGGSVVYLREAYHPVVGFMSGFTDWLVGGPASNAAIAIALMTVFKSFTNISDGQIKIFAVLLVIIMSTYHLFGVKGVSFVQNLSMIAKLAPILVIMFAALIMGQINPDMSLKSGVEYAFSHNTNVVSMVSLAIVAALWAYEGWMNLNIVAEEIKEPQKNLPASIIIAIGGITILYTLFNYAIYRVIPHSEIVEMINNGNLYLGTEVATRIFGNMGSILVNIAMLMAMFGSLNGLLLAQSRMYYAMAVEGHFFKSFAKLHPKYKVPTSAIIVQAVITIIYILARELDQLTNLVVVTAMVFKLLVVIAVLILRKKYPALERPYKVWLYPLSVVITAIIFFVLVVQAAMEDPVAGLAGIVVPLLGGIVYFIFDKKLKMTDKA